MTLKEAAKFFAKYGNVSSDYKELMKIDKPPIEKLKAAMNYALRYGKQSREIVLEAGIAFGYKKEGK